ncbi:Cytochrome b-c1 complex subunit-1, mitochondrial [Sesamum angolense]|uniref:Complex III subunit VI n=1 Tax=Sesamum angolense TaxID=2727404 RepID=A0AAE1X4F4_9LAMI|nr:Cytochrome b-c1 complex subunit-1, mitochondrial [Sesamum angolense]
MLEFLELRVIVRTYIACFQILDVITSCRAGLAQSIRADDEPVDPKRELEDRCKAPCTRPLKEYQACSKRIEGDDSGHKHCTGQYFDYWRCVDKCVATKLFTHLK